MRQKIWNIRSKILLGFILIIVFLGILLLTVASRLDDLQTEAAYISDHDLEVQNETNTIEKLVLDMETAQRGFILTGREAYLEPYNNAYSSWKATSDTLRGLIAGDLRQSDQLAKIDEEITDWIENAGNVSIEYKRQKMDDELEKFFENDPGKPLIDQIRRDFDNFRAYERNATQQRVVALEQGNRKLVSFILLLWLGVAGIALIAAIMVSNNIVSAIKQVTGAIRKIGTGGNLSDRITVRTKDEFRVLAQATNELLSQIEQENWQKEQLKEMALSLQNKPSTEELGKVLLQKLAELLQLPVAALYMLSKDGSRLVRAAAYNMEQKDRPAEFKFGEGLVGQCAVSKSKVQVKAVPSDALSIKSGFGTVVPFQVAAVPVVFEDHVVSVLEFGIMEELAADKQKFLSELLNTVGASIHSIRTKMELDHLYRETQAVNEELQVQTEELQSQAEELQTQTEELTMQAEELHHLNDRLESQKAVAEQSALELKKIAEELETSSNFKSEFLANMSHELRTPLNSMLILSQILSANQSGNMTKEEQNYASVIHSSGQDLLHLINDILDLSKVEAGQMDLNMMDVSIKDMLESLQLQFENTAKQKNLAFSVRMDDQVPESIRTDSMRVQQILKNLLSNAVKFTDQGEVSLVVEQKDGRFVPQIGKSVDVLAFIVRDTGIGIPQDKHESIFEAFRQAEGSTSRRFGGTGLGLSISLQLAKLLGGSISLESQWGGGSTFTFYLPLYEETSDLLRFDQALLPKPYDSLMEAQAAPTVETISAPVEELRSDEVRTEIFDYKTVLIVDDDIRNVYALTSFLEKLNMKVLIAQNGYESLDVVSQEPVDLVLMDIMMPEMDGYQAIREIRSTLGFTELPIIALTAKAMKEDRDKCLAAGASDYVSKPLDIHHVLGIMQVWLEKNNTQPTNEVKEF
ncbi:CHASE3 domain-containing protein [Paenibacillus physcomitrellae]|uniref:histidine kinase n=1 Tax=Paenibacillus physcomitrellae TaxID=1619311 RepID=A0ABQ1GQ29_9BACL|nr:CHASE3 domain-containing protein [Paenibacillus physcomitrellae]GGA48077.1 histidine kinase [Paenibacillus physcomitrellae]